MTQRISEIMVPELISLPAANSVTSAAVAMRDAGIGDVLVVKGDQVCGIVTDRDITVRVVAEGLAPAEVTLGQICSRELTTLAPSDSVADAVTLMRDRSLRRLPILEGGRPVGIVTLGDLAIERDPDSALASISSTGPNR